MTERNGGLMSVIVKGMKMPKNCLHCDFDDSYGICACRNEAPYVCEYSAKQRPSWCPLEEVPSAQPEKRTDKRTKTHSCDCISRQAAIDVLDRNRILGQGLLNDTLDHIADAIMALPSAQPEIVRCKDCMYWVAHDKRCVYLNHGFAPNMWCCHGRRTDEV